MCPYLPIIDRRGGGIIATQNILLLNTNKH